MPTERRPFEWHVENRIGRFSVSFALLDTATDAVARLLNGIAIVAATANYANDEIEYVGYSAFFKSVPDGESPPTYQAIVHCTLYEDEYNPSHVEWIALENPLARCTGVIAQDQHAISFYADTRYPVLQPAMTRPTQT